MDGKVAMVVITIDVSFHPLETHLKVFEQTIKTTSFLSKFAPEFYSHDSIPNTWLSTSVRY